MKLLFSLKSLGKKRPYLKELPIELDIASHTSLENFLKTLVKQQVEEFNQKLNSQGLIQFLSENSIEEKSSSGKVDFGEIYNQNHTDSLKAIQTVIQAFEDGLIAIFIGDEQIESIDSTISLQESDSISIIKLSFLSGTIW